MASSVVWRIFHRPIFTDAGMAGVIFDNYDIAGEVRACALLRFISMLSWLATGITCMVVTTGVEEKVVIASSF